jgi:FkbM family methyltransferase
MFYSQHEQDKFLEYEIFKGFKNGFFMDVGAYDGLHINNTLYFEKNNNWTGINVEPIKEVYDKLVVNRPNCINLNCAVSNNNGSAEFIKNKGYCEMISGLKEQYDPRHKDRLNWELQNIGGESQIIEVNTQKIETICDNNNIKHINYLSIDVEGAEFDVIKSINFNKIFIDVIGFENNFDDTSVPIIEYLQTKNYIEIYRTIDIFMIHKDSKFFIR